LGFLFAGTLMLAREAVAAGTINVGIHATVMRHASISSIRAPRSIEVSPEDVARGYVELGEPIELSIRTNAPEGVLIGFSLKSVAVHAAILEGEAGKLNLSRFGATLPVVKQGVGLQTQIVRLRARLELSAAAVPGTISFPIVMFVAPN